MRIYLSGPMRSYPEFNYPAFHKAAVELRGAGHTVWSPAENDTWDGTESGMFRTINMDLSVVVNWAEAVVVLPGWTDSTGARAEVFTAFWAEIPVLKAGSMRPISSDTMRVFYL